MLLLKESSKRVQDHLLANGFTFKVRELPGSSRTAQEAADSIGCSVAQIAKSLVFREEKTDEPILVIASGSNQVDVNKVKQFTGLTLGKADGTYVKERVGFAIGGVPPAGHNVPLKTILDRDLRAFEIIWAAAGTPFSVFQLSPLALGQLTNGIWMDLAKRP